MFLILLYTTTDYSNSYVDINVILPAIRLNTALSCRWSGQKWCRVLLTYGNSQNMAAEEGPRKKSDWFYDEDHWFVQPVGPVKLNHLIAMLLLLVILSGSKGPFYNWGPVIQPVMIISLIVLITWGWLKRGQSR